MSKTFHKIVSVVLLVSLTSSVLFGQKWRLRRYEVGVGFGTTQVFGDIGGTAAEENWFGLRDIKVNETKVAGEINVRYKIDPLYAISFHGALGFGSGDDVNSRNDRGRAYKTMIGEFSARWEYFLKPEDQYRTKANFNKRGMVNNYRSYGIYTFIGLGGIYYNPTVLSLGDKHNPERDLLKGAGYNIVIPFGVGARYVLNDQFVVGTELGWRWTGSDYIDGYSQSISSKNHDLYYLFLLTVNYRLKTSRRNLPVFLDRSFKAGPKRRRAI